MLRTTSPQIATRSDSRKKITWPACAPARGRREAGDLVALARAPGRRGAAGPPRRLDQRRRGGRRAPLDRPRPSITATSAAWQASGTPCAQTAGDPWWSGWAWVSATSEIVAARELGRTAAGPAPAGVDQHVLGEVDVDRRGGISLSRQTPAQGPSMLACPHRPAWVAAVLGQLPPARRSCAPLRSPGPGSEGERKIAELEELAEHSGDPRGTMGIGGIEGPCAGRLAAEGDPPPPRSTSTSPRTC